MSGFEVAGIVLGSLPLLVTTLETYCKFMREWGKASSELKSLNRQLSTERAKYYNVCTLLISDVVPQQDIESMLLSPFGPLWRVSETNDMIRQRLWDAYSPFEETVVEIQEALEAIMRRLRVQISQDGQVEWGNKNRMTREFRKLLYRLHRDDYKDDIATISKGISDLECLTKLSIKLEPSRKKQSRGKLFKILRDLSASIYRALCSSILCNDPHDVSLELSPRLIEIGCDRGDEKVLTDAQFKIAISFEMVEASTTKRFWDEVSIKTAKSMTTKRSQPCLPQPQAKWAKTVPSGNKSELPFTNSMRSKHNVKPAMAPFSRLATTGVAFTKTCDEEERALSKRSLNLCTAMRNARHARPVCYGHLIDTECADRHFQVYALGTTINSDGWSIVTLSDILEGKGGLNPLVSLAEKARLALAIASSVLQLSKTPWLPEALTRKRVHFFRRDETLSYRYPFLLRSFPLRPSQLPNPTAASGCIPLNNPTLFALGILLLEIILGQSFEQLRSPDEKPIHGDYNGVIRNSIAAHKLLERVALINTAYQAVIQRCIDCTETRGLDEGGFRQEVYNDVVLELEAILESTKLGM
ncbi:hypothetical protein FPSE_03392 [Fusarium pseudograminearum CS3096]|uniref:DUF7580 domain-containing protein n=1 Tax=Fusarium pseudograminearum (strain CS3096) TaxID=1028729 RepID=K3VR59_FUSPC|nr:hypothetical protein FPSE_03392 [Fusarium pseudograminearum CS3096]EKJ76393.1 hypothetical protein FPSE_03392 [Fusarium pseudograminearum CS3096]